MNRCIGLSLGSMLAVVWVFWGPGHASGGSVRSKAWLNLVVDQPLFDQPLVDQPLVDQPLVDQPLVD